MNLILDTNAFLYFFKAINGISTPEKWGGRNFNKNEYLNYCLSSSKIIVTGETLYELLLQSLRVDNTINQFIEHYNFMNKVNKDNPNKVIILSSLTGMKFDSIYFAECVKNNDRFDEVPWLNIKITEEVKVIGTFIRVLLNATCNVLHTINGDKVFEDDYIKAIEDIQVYIDESLLNLYNKCYIKREIDNKQFENNLDKILKKVFEYIFKKINNYSYILGGDKVFFEELNSKEENGVKYLSKVFNKITSKNSLKPREIFKRELKESLELLKTNGFSYQEVEFIYYILEKYITQCRSIKKNDIIDYLIVTALNPNTEIKVKEDVDFGSNEKPKGDNTFLITFDKVLYEFSKSICWLYQDNIYDNFLDK